MDDTTRRITQPRLSVHIQTQIPYTPRRTRFVHMSPPTQNIFPHHCCAATVYTILRCNLTTVRESLTVLVSPKYVILSFPNWPKKSRMPLKRPGTLMASRNYSGLIAFAASLFRLLFELDLQKNLLNHNYCPSYHFLTTKWVTQRISANTVLKINLSY